MSSEIECDYQEAHRRGAAWASGLVSAASVLPDDLDTVRFLLWKVTVNLAEERGAEFAKAFGEAARVVIMEAEGRDP
jgi:hypothetical protein